MVKILSLKPNQYLEQGLTQCGAYSVKAILSAYGKDVKGHPREYQPNLFTKYTGTNIGPSFLDKILKKYGVHARKAYVTNLSDTERLEVLKKSLDNNSPVMLRIGNGYGKDGKYRPWVASFLGHWITLWGYDDEKGLFYVYDSYVAKNKHDKTVPIGNITRTYAEVLRDWGKGFPFAWRYLYIKVG